MPKKKQTHKPRKKVQQPVPRQYNAITADGLVEFGRRELAVKLDKRVTLHRTSHNAPPGTIQFDYTGGLRALLRMRTIENIYLIHHFDVPRPRALLGDEHLRTLLQDIAAIRAIHPEDAFKTFYLNAAGANSAVLERLKREIARATKLKSSDEEGDLLLRLRRPLQKIGGWEVLMRISPRPLTTRPWRVHNMQGALNATVAHAMALMTDPMPHDHYLNLACGSGTLLIERMAATPARSIIGCDTDAEALEGAAKNIAAAGYTDTIELQSWDITNLPIPDASIDALTADLPFGHLVGSHQDNLSLYPAMLTEAGRVAKPGALLVLITHEVKLLQRELAASNQWQFMYEQRVSLGGLNPRIFVLRRYD